MAARMASTIMAGSSERKVYIELVSPNRNFWSVLVNGKQL